MVSPRAKVTIDSLSRTWGINWYQNKWPWPLQRSFKVMPTMASH